MAERSCLDCKHARWGEADEPGLCSYLDQPSLKGFPACLFVEKYALNPDRPFTGCPTWEAKTAARGRGGPR